MASKEIFATDSGLRLIGGLEWRLLDANMGVGDALRATGRERSATHAASAVAIAPESVQVGKKVKELRRVAAGFLASPDGEGPGKKAHSLAAAFALWTAEHPKAALSVRTPKGSVALVVVLNGLPYLDKVVEDATEAYSIVTGYLKDHPTISIFSDDIEKFPSSIMDHGLLDAIAASAGKTTTIKAIPADAVKLILIAGLVIGSLLGYQFYKDKQEQEAKKLALQQLQEEDPIPKYLNALMTQSGTLGVESKSLLAAFESTKRVPFDVGGWKLKKVECNQSTQCLAVYERTHGTYSRLVPTVPFMKLLQNDSMDLNEAPMAWTQPMEPSVLKKEGVPASVSAFIQGPSGSMLQNWMVAGLGLQLQPPMLWPQVPGVPPAFKHPEAISVGSLQITDVPLPLVGEVITGAPSNFIWSGFSIEFGETTDEPLARAKVKLSGSYYVQN